jgi:hypothetical protein
VEDSIRRSIDSEENRVLSFLTQFKDPSIQTVPTPTMKIAASIALLATSASAFGSFSVPKKGRIAAKAVVSNAF